MIVMWEVAPRGTLSFNILNYLCQTRVWGGGVLDEGILFSPTLLLFNFIICTYSIHHILNDKFSCNLNLCVYLFFKNLYSLKN
jgi:hypothetical protein